MIKLLLSSTLSNTHAKFVFFDIANFYLSTSLDCPKYVKIQLTVIPEEFISKYNLTNYAYSGWIHFEIKKGVYAQSNLANNLLVLCLEPHGYYQCTTMPGLWHHHCAW